MRDVAIHWLWFGGVNNKDFWSLRCMSVKSHVKLCFFSAGSVISNYSVCLIKLFEKKFWVLAIVLYKQFHWYIYVMHLAIDGC